MIFQILIVDDEPHVVDAIRGILEQEPEVDLEIHTAFRGQQALKLCQQYPISLLITDIRMPDMSGLELARQVRQLTPDCNVILLTAYSDFTYAYEGIQLHACDYILKTEDKQIIRSRIFKILGTMEQELRHRSWLESARESNPISDRLCKKLLMPQRSSQQEEAFTLLGFRETGFPLLLIAAKTPSHIPIQADILQKSLMRCLSGRITHLCASTISENVCSLVLSLDPKGHAITGTWLMVTMERIQALYTATTQAECAILYSYPIDNLDQLSGKYQIAARYLEAERFDACVKVISDVKKESPLVTIHFVKRYVKEHLNQDLSLSQISVVTGYNPTYLSRLFKEQTGETLNRYISRKRMEYIARLMRDPQISMQQIMDAAGFTTRSYFNQFVKKETGLTPKQYRMQMGTQLPE